MKNICFVGRIGSGKTTLSEALVKEHQYQRLSFAVPVKIAACRVYNLMQEATDSGERPLRDISMGDLVRDKEKYRTLLQLTGTELGRDLFGEDVWVNKLLRQMEYYSGPVVVDDVRFRNELAALLNNDFFPIYLTRTKKASNHSSESFTKESFEHFMHTMDKKLGADYLVLDNHDVDEYTTKEAVLNIAEQLANS